MNFRDDLIKSAKSDSEIKNNQANQEVARAEYWATEHYNELKEELKREADFNGYRTIGGKKVISADIKVPFLPIIEQTHLSLGTDPYLVKERGIKYIVKNQRAYEAYIATLKKLGETDGVNVVLCAKYCEDGEFRYFSVPGGKEKIGKHASTCMIKHYVDLVLKGEVNF